MPVGRFAAGPAPDAVVLAYLPFVGIVVGGLAGGLALWASTGFGHVVAVALAFGLSIVLTGAIHVDGFMDSCDALFASVPLERRFEILKDPRHGTFAIAFFAAAAALWIAALWSLPAPLLPQSVAFAAGGARMAAVTNAYIVPYARAGAVTAAFSERPPVGVLFVAAVALVALAFTIAPWAWTLLVVVLVGSLAAGQRLKRRLGGGLTGDVYGYLVVCCEIALSIGIIAILRYT